VVSSLSCREPMTASSSDAVTDIYAPSARGTSSRAASWARLRRSPPNSAR
jgi:hypothetical protein